MENYNPQQPILVRENLKFGTFPMGNIQYGSPLLRVSLTQEAASAVYRQFQQQGTQVSVIKLSLADTKASTRCKNDKNDI